MHFQTKFFFDIFPSLPIFWYNSHQNLYEGTYYEK